MEWINGITEWLLKYGIYLVPIVVIIFVTHVLKELIKDTILKSTLTLIISLIISVITSFLLDMYLGFDIWKMILMSLLYWSISGFITTLNDVLIKNNLYQLLIDIIKNKFGGKT